MCCWIHIYFCNLKSPQFRWRESASAAAGWTHGSQNTSFGAFHLFSLVIDKNRRITSRAPRPEVSISCSWPFFAHFDFFFRPSFQGCWVLNTRARIVARQIVLRLIPLSYHFRSEHSSLTVGSSSQWRSESVASQVDQ